MNYCTDIYIQTHTHTHKHMIRDTECIIFRILCTSFTHVLAIHLHVYIFMYWEKYYGHLSSIICNVYEMSLCFVSFLYCWGHYSILVVQNKTCFA